MTLDDIDAEGEAALERLENEPALQELLKTDPAKAMREAGFPELNETPVELDIAALEAAVDAMSRDSAPLMGASNDVTCHKLGKNGVDIVFSKDGTKKLLDVGSFGAKATALIKGGMVGLGLIAAGPAAAIAAAVILVLEIKMLQVKLADKGKGVHVPIKGWKIKTMVCALATSGVAGLGESAALLVHPKANK